MNLSFSKNGKQWEVPRTQLFDLLHVIKNMRVEKKI